ncbi:MAG: LysE family translocator [Candidatus Dormiibacterota bacterium]
MDLPGLFAFSAIAFLVIVIPGPSVLFIVSRVVSLGRRAALGTVVGNSLREFIQVVVVALGLGQLLEHSAMAFTVVKLVGAVYLLFLGVQAWRRRRSVGAELVASAAPRRRRRIVWDGLVVGLTNPNQWCSSPRCCQNSSTARWATPHSSCCYWDRCGLRSLSYPTVPAHWRLGRLGAGWPAGPGNWSAPKAPARG